MYERMELPKPKPRYEIRFCYESIRARLEEQGFYQASDAEAEYAGAMVNEMWDLAGRRAFLRHVDLPSLDTPEGVDAAEFWALAMEDYEGREGYIQYVMLRRT